MGSLVLKFDSKPRYTLEEMKKIAKIELEKLKNMPDEDENIDFSDIPALTDEELEKFKPARLRRRKSQQNIAS